MSHYIPQCHSRGCWCRCDDAAAASACHALLLSHWTLLQRSMMSQQPLVKRAGVMAMWKLAEDETATISLCKIPALFNDLTNALSDSNKETVQLAMLAVWQACRASQAAAIICRCRSLFPSIRSILKVWSQSLHAPESGIQKTPQSGDTIFMSRDYSPGYTQRSAFIHQVRIFPRLHVEMTARQCSPAKKSHELNEQMHRCSSLLSVRCERRQVPVATTTRACLCCMHDDDDGDYRCRRQLLDDVQLSGALWGQRNSVDVHTRRCLC